MSKSLKIAAVLAGLCLLAIPAQAGKLNLGREALPDEVAAWDKDVRPDGQGLPAGKGSVKEGEALYLERCASCHGEFGEGAGRPGLFVRRRVTARLAGGFSRLA